MKFEFDARVFSADGDEVGLVREVILDPRTHEVVELVLRQGLLFSDDRLIGVDQVASTGESGVVLKCSTAEIGGLSEEYREGEYVSMEKGDAQEGVAPAKLWAPPPAASASLVPPGLAAVELSHDTPIPIQDVALLHGSTVVALDDEPVGTVSALLTDADRRLTHLVISQGMVRPRSKLIPLNWTVAFEDNRVVLAVAAPVVARLPDYYEE